MRGLLFEQLIKKNSMEPPGEDEINKSLRDSTANDN